MFPDELVDFLARNAWVHRAPDPETRIPWYELPGTIESPVTP